MFTQLRSFVHCSFARAALAQCSNFGMCFLNHDPPCLLLPLCGLGHDGNSGQEARKTKRKMEFPEKKRQVSSCGNDDYIDDDVTPDPEPPEPKAMDLDIAEVGYKRRCHVPQANSSAFDHRATRMACAGKTNFNDLQVLAESAIQD